MPVPSVTAPTNGAAQNPIDGAQHGPLTYPTDGSLIPPPSGPPLKIAMVAPLAESVPPSHYGGTERVVSVLTEELVRRGHDVTLFASGDSRDHGRLWCRAARQGLRRDPVVTRLPGVHDDPARRSSTGTPTNSTSSTTTSITSPSPPPGSPHADGDDDPRPARPARGSAGLRRLRRAAAGRDQQRPARLSPRRQLGRRPSQRRRPRQLPLPARTRATTSCSSGGSARRSAPTAPSKSRATSGMRLVMAAKVDAVDRDYYEHAIAPRHPRESVARRVRRRGGRARRRTRCWAGRGPTSSRSTGRNRSG